MSRAFVLNFLRFILLAGIQVIILNRIQLAGFLNPLLYVLFILMLPFETPGWLLLLASFAMGLTIDSYSDTGGLHAIASTFIAFIRPTVLRIISSRQDYEPGMSPSLWDMGFVWFIKYALILVSIHHFVFFAVEAGRFAELHLVLYRTLLSVIFSLLLVIIAQYLFFRPRS
jgi:rod shape-determining protein MreD